MKTVIYTEDMEPITIIDLPLDLIEIGEAHQYINVPVPIKLDRSFFNPADPITEVYRVVTLRFERLKRFNSLNRLIETHIVTTNHDEFALALTPSWLPGQQCMVNEYEGHVKELQNVLLNVLRGMC